MPLEPLLTIQSYVVILAWIFPDIFSDLISLFYQAGQ